MRTNHTKKKGQKNHYNTAEVSISIYEQRQLLITSSSINYLENMVHYSAATNKLLDSSGYQEMIDSTNSDLLIKTEVKNWFSHKPNDQPVNKFKLSKLHSFLTLFFINPLAFGSKPFVDMLYLTIDVTEKELRNLSGVFLKQPPVNFKVTKQGRASALKNYKDVYQRFAFLSTGQEDLIVLLWGIHPKVLEKRPKQRLLKVTLNPARYNDSELKAFFSWLKKALGSNTKRKLVDANVTRLDIALDIVGLHLPELLVDQTGCTEYDYFLNESSDDEVVGTQRIGDPETSHFRAYNKLQKLIDIGPGSIPILSFKDAPFQPLQITRLERQRKPHDSGGLRLAAIGYDAPYFLKGTKIYSPRLLLKLNEKQQKLVRKYGFMYWYSKKNGSSVISAQDLKAHEIPINHELLETAQNQTLKQLKQLIIDA